MIRVNGRFQSNRGVMQPATNSAARKASGRKGKFYFNAARLICRAKSAKGGLSRHRQQLDTIQVKWRVSGAPFVWSRRSEGGNRIKRRDLRCVKPTKRGAPEKFGSLRF